MAETHAAAEVDALLPRGTIVRIAGNNRTKWDLVGKQGVVNNAQMLGGWHEVLLENSTSTVRVQRNALEIVAPPSERTQALPSPPDKTSTIVDASLVRKRKRKPPTQNSVDLAKLDEDTLRRYRRFFKLNVRKDCAKDELLFAVRRHFARTKVDESDVIVRFLSKVGSSESRLPIRDSSGYHL